MKRIMYRLLIVSLFIGLLLFSGCSGNSGVSARPGTSDATEKSEPEISLDELPQPSASIMTVSVKDVISAFDTLCKSKDSNATLSIAESDIEVLGNVGENFVLYKILPPNAAGDFVVVLHTFQGFTITSGICYKPSAYAIYLYDKDNQIMYTIEDGADLVDFSEVYMLLPDSLKQ